MKFFLFNWLFPSYLQMNVAAATVGAAVVGGAISSNAAGKASDAQSDSAAQADATQRYMYDQTRSDNAPYREAGVAANNLLAQYLGLPGYANGAGPNPEFLAKAWVDKNWKAGVYKNNPSLSKFTRQQLEQGWIDNYRNGIYGTADDARKALGYVAPEGSGAGSGVTGSLLKKFDQNDLNNDPIYQNTINFALDQGVQGINRQAAASGGLLNGGVLKALSRFGANTAATYGNDSFNRDQVNKNAIYNKLAGVSGAGQAATNQVSASGQNYANQVSSNQIGVGNARGASAIAGANSFNNALGQGINAYQQNQLINSLGNNNGYNGYNVNGAYSGQF